MQHLVKPACLIGLCFILIQLTGCASSPPAPVVDRTPAKPSSQETAKTQTNTNIGKPAVKNTSGDWRPDTYTVKKGDTLLRISLELGYYYKDIAQANNIVAPYPIQVGQVLQLKSLKEKALNETKPAQPTPPMIVEEDVVITPVEGETSTPATTTETTTPPVVVAISEPKAVREPYSDEALKKPLPSPNIVLDSPTKAETGALPPKTGNTADTGKMPNSETKPEAKPEAKPVTENSDDIAWAWPAKGKVVGNFNEGNNKGIDIAGSLGQAVTAAAPGRVIYSGSDLRGYGKLVIIKHNANYLSVYAHNSAILVKEGQNITRGQKIAEMGNTDTNSVKLHFEIRRQGKSVDPSKYLAAN